MISAALPKNQAFINRELSWLAFNERVLEEASDPTTPLLERVKFAAICASNLDEFFMVRVAGLEQAVDEGDTAEDFSGMTPAQQLDAVRTRARSFMQSLYGLTMNELLPALAAHGIRVLAPADLPEARRAALAAYFRESVLPVLTPLAIDVSRPFPLLSSLSLNIAVLLEAPPGEEERRLALVQVPPGLARLVAIPGADGDTFVLLEDIIRAHLTELFPGQPIVEAAAMRLARDAELELDDEGGRTHLEIVEREVRRRRRNQIVRLEIDAAASKDLAEQLRQLADVAPEAVYEVPGPLDLRVLTAITELPGLDELRDPPLQPAEF
ncbi:MAG TPA: hypothetical protein VNK41_00660, partial [Vicinamibacterales bacterium]|nr:hypothetical protein [Vicinamibacterales bacterium]